MEILHCRSSCSAMQQLCVTQWREAVLLRQVERAEKEREQVDRALNNEQCLRVIRDKQIERCALYLCSRGPVTIRCVLMGWKQSALLQRRSFTLLGNLMLRNLCDQLAHTFSCCYAAWVQMHEIQKIAVLQRDLIKCRDQIIHQYCD